MVTLQPTVLCALQVRPSTAPPAASSIATGLDMWVQVRGSQYWYAELSLGTNRRPPGHLLICGNNPITSKCHT